MSFAFSSLISEWRQMRRFQRLSPENRNIVFYAENESSYVHFEPIINALLKIYQGPICYLTSSPHDHILKSKNKRIQTFYVGNGMVRTILFKALQAGVMVMTMPDLGTYYIQRSSNPVHYIYVHHSMVSMHMIYRKEAFDHFDTIFCVGPHHMDEIREMEKIYRLPEKILFKHGYGNLDSLMQKNEKRQEPGNVGVGKKVLIAPSWGPNGLLEACGGKLVEILLAANYHVIVRPHPRTKLHAPDVLNSLRARFSENSNFYFEENIVSQESLHASDVMISDWSGAALEYAFGLERPVLFIDVPRKVNNDEYERIRHEPLEVFIRSEVGTVLPLDQLHKAPVCIEELFSNQRKYLDSFRRARGKWVFNIACSGEKGGAYIAQMVSDLESK